MQSQNKGLNKKINYELRRLHMSYNPTVYDITEILLVSGTDETYKAPVKFEEAWNDPDKEMRDNWKSAV